MSSTERSGAEIKIRFYGRKCARVAGYAAAGGSILWALWELGRGLVMAEPPDRLIEMSERL